MLAHSKKEMQDGGGCNDTPACLKEPAMSSSVSDGPLFEAAKAIGFVKPLFCDFTRSRVQGKLFFACSLAALNLLRTRAWMALFHLCS